jgi:hypothetical protein
MMWRADSQELVYGESRLDTSSGAVKKVLFRMASDGTARKQIPLPANLCAAHPSYLTQDTIVFTGWRCGGAECSCAPDKL